MSDLIGNKADMLLVAPFFLNIRMHVLKFGDRANEDDKRLDILDLRKKLLHNLNAMN